jgi:murein DD-endopeptidase MepM/ murein hydrolase activator NlpD
VTVTRLLRRTLPVLLLCVLAFAAPAAGESIEDEKAAVDAEIAELRDKIAAAREREDELSAQIDAVTVRIRSLEAEVGDVTVQVESLERDLALHQERLDRINELFEVQTQRLVFLRRQYEAATRRLNDRLVEIYKSDEPTQLDVILNARSFTEILDQLDYVSAIGSQDKRIAGEVAVAKTEIRRARLKTAKIRRHVAAAKRTVQARAEQVRAVRDELISTQSELEGAKSEKEQTLGDVQHTKQEYIAEVDALAAVSGELAAKIQAAQSSSSGAPPSAAARSGAYIWPCSGPMTSPFGWRWGRMHEGIDIGCGYGAPAYASAAGTVIVAGWMGGYGNLVVIDHGNGIATAYGHNSSISVSVGQAVSQGQVIAAIGSTGHSTGPHCHFEVRVNGAPVDPLGYL